MSAVFTSLLHVTMCVTVTVKVILWPNTLTMTHIIANDLLVPSCRNRLLILMFLQQTLVFASWILSFITGLCSQ